MKDKNVTPEKDILRGRLAESLDEAALRFVSSIQDDSIIAGDDVIGTMAHDYMLHKQGIITRDEARALLKELLGIHQAIEAGRFDASGVYEDIHPVIESRVIDALGPDVGGKMHSGRSRNDQVALDIRLRLRQFLLEAREALLGLLDVLLVAARKHADVPFPLFTHTQPAQVGTFGHLVTGWAFEITRHLARLAECFQRTNLSPLGACAIGGTSFPIDRDLVASLLGFAGIVENSIDAISSRDVLIENAANVASIAVSLGRIAEDLILYASHEFRYVSLPDKFCSVSSALPQKKNPDTLELIRSFSATCIGALSTQLVLAKGMPTGYNRDFQDCKPPLWQTYSKLTRAARLLSSIIEGTSLDTDAINRSLARSDLVALDAAEYLCTVHGVPFRKSHEFMAAVVARSRHEGRELGSPWERDARVLVSDLAARVLGNPGVVDDGFFSVMERRDVHARASAGGPSPGSMAHMFAVLSGERETIAAAMQRDAVATGGAVRSFLERVRELVA